LGQTPKTDQLSARLQGVIEIRPAVTACRARRAPHNYAFIVPAIDDQIWRVVSAIAILP
jgi:hypothetical protein